MQSIKFDFKNGFYNGFRGERFRGREGLFRVLCTRGMDDYLIAIVYVVVVWSISFTER